jgi:heme-degrading monooxygenase HmoA
MPVTEFAILPLTRSLTKDNPTLPETLIDKLRIAKTVLEQASKYKFHYFQQIEDPSIVYIIGKWDSPEAHYAFLPSAENQKLLELFKEDIIMDGEDEEKKMQMWHLDNDVFAVASNTEWVFNAPVISCNRHFVPKEQKSDFIEQFNEVKGILEEFTKPYGVVGGWRIEKEAEEKEEWVLYSGFESVDNHMQFAKTGGFEKYREIVRFVAGFQLKHLRAIKGL